MSGIAGFVNLDDAPAERPRIDAMLATMRRRGPDGLHAWTGGIAALGQALLATTQEGLAERQPWTHPQTGCVVVSDSRLDNRPQLLRQLGIDANPDDIGDGELLHAAWQRWGDDCADHLRGDFAFALWNPSDRRLFCARDPMGVRPFCYHFGPGERFVFGSVASTVMAHGAVPDVLDEGRIADAVMVLTEGLDQTSTFQVHVQRLPPAHTLNLRDGVLRTRCYWHPLKTRPSGLPRTDDGWVEAQRDVLETAVRQRLRSHRRIGSMLSGGLDSSSAAALACKLAEEVGNAPFPTFSATNRRDPECLETRMIRAATASLRCDPAHVDVGDVPTLVPGLLEWWTHLEEPFDGNMVLLASIYLSAYGKGVVGMLDGVPADNLYAVSGLPQQLARLGRWSDAFASASEIEYASTGRRTPASPLKLVASMLEPRWATAMRRAFADWRFQHRFIHDRSLLDPGFSRRIDAPGRLRRVRRAMADAHRWSTEPLAHSSMGAFYITSGLERYNRIASHFGIEPRPPYVDRDLIEFHAHLPPPLRVRDGQFKWPLRQAMTSLLPPEVVWRRHRTHLGSQFNRALLAQARDHQRLAPCHAAPWLDQNRLASDWNVPADAAPDRLLAAQRLLAWLSRHAPGG